MSLTRIDICLLYNVLLRGNINQVTKSKFIFQKKSVEYKVSLNKQYTYKTASSINIPSLNNKPDFLPFCGKDTDLQVCVGLISLLVNPDMFFLHIQNYEPKKITQKFIIHIKLPNYYVI